MELSTLAKSEYRTLYRNRKWTAAKKNPGLEYLWVKDDEYGGGEENFLVDVDIPAEDVRMVVEADMVVTLVVDAADIRTSINTTVASRDISTAFFWSPGGGAYEDPEENADRGGK